MKVKQVVKTVGGFVKKHERVILTIVTIGAEAVAIYEGLKQGPKFQEMAEEFEAKKNAGEKVDGIYVLKRAAGPVLKVAIPFAISSGAAILNHRRASEQIQSLTGLYLMTKEAKEAYEEQIKKRFGEEKAEEIKTEMYREQSNLYDHSASTAREYINTGHGNGRFYETWNGRPFLSDINFLKRIENDLNKLLMNEMWVSVNDVNAEIGLPRTDTGDELGWNANVGRGIEFKFDCQLDDNDIPFTIVSFVSPPNSKWEQMGRW